MCPIYSYENPKTGEIFEEIRSFKNSDKPFILENGTKCKRVLFPLPTKGTSGHAIIDKNREIFEADREYVKKMRPRFVKLQSGERVRYDPSKHN